VLSATFPGVSLKNSNDFCRNKSFQLLETTRHGVAGLHSKFLFVSNWITLLVRCRSLRKREGFLLETPFLAFLDLSYFDPGYVAVQVGTGGRKLLR